MIKWKKIKADYAMPARRKDLIFLWDLVRRGGETTPPKRFEEDIDMDRGVDSEVDDNLCKGDKQHEVTSVLI